nr:retrovirus-related Pol polyprotein from transposon TNT 1-94 [Tanacetum cinerariifolium]
MTHLSKSAHSSVKRPIQNKTAFNNSNVTQKVNTVRSKTVNTARPTAVVNVVHGNVVNAIKALACWVWKPKNKVIDHVSKNNSASNILKKFDYIDAQGRSNGFSSHITGNMSYLIDYEEIDGGYITFGGNQSNVNAGTKVCDDAGRDRMETVPCKDYILLPLWNANPLIYQESKRFQDAGFQPSSVDGKKVDEDPRQESKCKDQKKKDNDNSTNYVIVAGINRVNDEEADLSNLNTTIQVSPTPTTRIHKDHPLDQVIATGTKWVFKNKKDERGIVIKNKARLVAQGHTQEEGIDYDEVFAPVARIEAIRLFLDYASFKDFMMHLMNVKSAFLYRKIEEDVYVFQPLGFEDLDFPDKVYKVEKALYGLYQAPRAWYEIVSTYLLDNGFHRGKIDKTLFINRHKDDILLVQVYVDDIIFSSTKKELCNAFEKMMHEKFQMSSIGELTFFLGLQEKQKQDGIFISQDKYVTEILRKYGFLEVKNASTPMETQKPLLKDEDGEEVYVHMYRSMIDTLMYLTSSRTNIMFVVLVPSCFGIFDLEPLSLSFDFVFAFEIFKSLSFSLDHHCHLTILCLNQHAHTLHHLKSLLTISLDRLDILKEDLVYQSLRKSSSLCLSFLDS